MKIEVRYQSRGGNTRAAALEIAGVLGAEAKPITEPVSEKADLLVLCAGTYAFKADPDMLAFIAALDPAKVGTAAVFVTASGTQHGIKGVKKALEERGIPVFEEKLLRMGTQGFALMGRTGGTLTQKQAEETRAFAEKLR